MENNNKNYAELQRLNLCKLIRKSGMSVPILARKANATSLAIYRILNANQNPSYVLKIKLCRALGTTVRELNNL